MLGFPLMRKSSCCGGCDFDFDSGFDNGRDGAPRTLSLEPGRSHMRGSVGSAGIGAGMRQWCQSPAGAGLHWG